MTSCRFFHLIACLVMIEIEELERLAVLTWTSIEILIIGKKQVREKDIRKSPRCNAKNEGLNMHMIVQSKRPSMRALGGVCDERCNAGLG